MNYQEHLKGFYLRRQVKSISYNALILYYLLTEQFNSCGFPRSMPIPISRLAGETGLTRRQLIKARKELIEKGYIQIVPVPESGKRIFDIPPLTKEAAVYIPLLPVNTAGKGEYNAESKKI